MESGGRCVKSVDVWRVGGKCAESGGDVDEESG